MAGAGAVIDSERVGAAGIWVCATVMEVGILAVVLLAAVCVGDAVDPAPGEAVFPALVVGFEEAGSRLVGLLGAASGEIVAVESFAALVLPSFMSDSNIWLKERALVLLSASRIARSFWEQNFSTDLTSSSVLSPAR